MSKFKTSALALIVALSGSASAGGMVSNIENVQVGWSHVYSNLHLDAKWVGGDIRGTSTAIGNNAISDTMGVTVWFNYQIQMADVGADVNAKIKGVGGDVDLAAVGICNNAAMNTSRSEYVFGRNQQRCNTIDPYANINVAAFEVDGGVGATATAVANNLSVDAETARADILSMQANASAVVANVNAQLADVGGSVNLSATAIGNNASINHRFGAP